MKKVLFLMVACAMSIGIISCANNAGDKTTAEGTQNENVEQVEKKVDLNELVAKAKAEGANWSVDQWKAAFKDLLIGAKPMLDFMKDLKEKMENNSDEENLQLLGELEQKSKEFEPIEKAFAEFNEAANASENGKKVVDDEEWGKQVLKELGYPEDVLK